MAKIGVDPARVVSRPDDDRGGSGHDSQDGRWHEEGLRVSLSRFNATKKGVLEDDLDFQVPPLEEFSWTQAASHQDFDTLSRGQFSRRGARSLLTFELRTMVLDYQPHWVAWRRARPNQPHPQRVAQLLKHLVQLGTPIMFHARSAYWEGPDLRLPVTLRSVTVAERAGEIETRYFDMSFVEWREQELDRKDKGKKRDRHALPTTVEIQASGVVVEADGGKIGSRTDAATLQDLAQHFYGDPTYWRPIVRENGIEGFAPSRPLNELKKNGKTIRKLRIPDLADPKTGGLESPV
jgi:hypothetical protein